MKRTPKPKRYEYGIYCIGDTWVCKVAGAIVASSVSRNELIQSIACDLWRYARYFGQHSELIIHRKDGTIGRGSSSRRTYGSDDPKSKG